jgi:hypothetical protein
MAEETNNMNLSNRQSRIYAGLQKIGPGIAGMFLDAVHIANPITQIISKTNLIGHLAREIDSSLKDALLPTSSEVSAKEETKSKDKRCSLMEGPTHRQKIMLILRKTDEGDKLVKEWFDVSDTFHRMAHRRAFYQPVRPVEEMLGLWERYEKILEVFVGSFYSMTDLLDRYLTLENPKEDAFGFLANTLQDKQHAFYFFKNLCKPGWLPGLQKEGYFDTNKFPKPLTENGELEELIPVRCLSPIAKHRPNNQEELLLSIVESIMDAFVRDEIALHPFTISLLTESFSSLDSARFSENAYLFFFKVSTTERRNQFPLYINYLCKDLPEKLISNRDKESLLCLCRLVFGFTTYEEPGIDMPGWSTEPTVQRHFLIDASSIAGFLTQYSNRIIPVCGSDSIAIAINSLIKLEKIESYGLSKFGITSIEQTEQTEQTYFGYAWEHSLVNFIRDGHELLDEIAIRQLVNDLLDKNISILQRLAIHIICEHYEQLQNIWWQRIIGTVYEDVYIHESYRLMDKYSAGFSVSQMTLIINWIKSMYELPNAIKSNPAYQQNTYYHIRRWLSALHSSAETKEILDSTNEFYNNLNKAVLEHPSFDSYHTSHTGYQYPVEPQTFGDKTVEDQVKYIAEFVPDHPMDSSADGLNEILKYCILLDPYKYNNKLDQFLSLNFLYAVGILDAFKDALIKDNQLDYLAIIGFIENKLLEEGFVDNDVLQSHYQRWFLFGSTDFVSLLVTRSEQFGLNENNVERIIDFLLLVLRAKAVKAEDRTNNEKHADYRLDSIQFKYLETLLEAAKCWSSNFSVEDDPIKWPEKIKNFFTEKLDRTDAADRDFSILLGMHLMQFYQFDQVWVNSNIDRIFNKTVPEHFRLTLSGSLSGFYLPSKPFYELFTRNNLFEKALDIFVTNKDNGEVSTIATYALIEWVQWNITATEKQSLLHSILNRSNTNQVKVLIEVSSRQYHLPYEKTIELWTCILDLYANHSDWRPIYIMSLWFIERLQKLDADSYTLIKRVIDNVPDGDMNLYGSLRYIYEHAVVNLETAADILIDMIGKVKQQPYFDGYLYNVVSKLYDSGLKEKADIICRLVSETGSLALKTLYNSKNL